MVQVDNDDGQTRGDCLEVREVESLSVIEGLHAHMGLVIPALEGILQATVYRLTFEAEILHEAVNRTSRVEGQIFGQRVILSCDFGSWCKSPTRHVCCILNLQKVKIKKVFYGKADVGNRGC